MKQLLRRLMLLTLWSTCVKALAGTITISGDLKLGDIGQGVPTSLNQRTTITGGDLGMVLSPNSAGNCSDGDSATALKRRRFLLRAKGGAVTAPLQYGNITRDGLVLNTGDYFTEQDIIDGKVQFNPTAEFPDGATEVLQFTARLSGCKSTNYPSVLGSLTIYLNKPPRMTPFENNITIPVGGNYDLFTQITDEATVSQLLSRIQATSSDGISIVPSAAGPTTLKLALSNPTASPATKNIRVVVSDGVNNKTVDQTFGIQVVDGGTTSGGTTSGTTTGGTGSPPSGAFAFTSQEYVNAGSPFLLFATVQGGTQPFTFSWYSDSARTQLIGNGQQWIDTITTPGSYFRYGRVSNSFGSANATTRRFYVNSTVPRTVEWSQDYYLAPVGSPATSCIVVNAVPIANFNSTVFGDPAYVGDLSLTRSKVKGFANIPALGLGAGTADIGFPFSVAPVTQCRPPETQVTEFQLESMSSIIQNASLGNRRTTRVVLLGTNEFKAPTVRFVSELVVTNESLDPSVLIGLKLTPPTNIPVTVSYLSVGGTATEGVDWEESGSTGPFRQTTFNPGEMYKDIVVSIFDDDTPEGDESFGFRIVNATAARVGTSSNCAVVIKDNNGGTNRFTMPTAVVSDDARVVKEGDVAFITAFVDPPNTNASSVRVVAGPNFKTADASDITTPTNWVMDLPKGFSVGQFSVKINNDTTPEPVEVLGVKLRSATGATLGKPDEANVIIPANDSHPDQTTATNFGLSAINFSNSLFRVQEANITVGAGGRIYPPNTNALTLVVQSQGYTATPGQDYVASSNVIFVAPGDPTFTAASQILDDQTPEPDEVYAMIGTSLTAQATFANQSVRIITSNDGGTNINGGVPTVTLVPAARVVREGGIAATLVRIDPPATNLVRVSGSVVYESAQPSDVSEVRTNDVVLPAGIPFAGIAVATVVNDTNAEPDEVFGYRVNLASGAAIGVNPITRFIIEAGDGYPIVPTNRSTARFLWTPPAVTVPETNASAVLQVSLANAITNPAAITVVTTNGTAEAGSDYTAVSTTLTFAPGQVTRSIGVPILDDTEAESVESFGAELRSPVNGTVIPPNPAVVTIDRSDGGGSGVPGDIDNDGFPDILWQRTLNKKKVVAAHFISSNLTVKSFATVAVLPSSKFTAVGFGDVNGDGNQDILFTERGKFGKKETKILVGYGPSSNSLSTPVEFRTIDIQPGIVSVGNVLPDAGITNKYAQVIIEAKSAKIKPPTRELFVSYGLPGQAGQLRNLGSLPKKYRTSTVRDVDGDGKPDIVATHKAKKKEITAVRFGLSNSAQFATETDVFTHPKRSKFGAAIDLLPQVRGTELLFAAKEKKDIVVSVLSLSNRLGGALQPVPGLSQRRPWQLVGPR